MRNFYLITIFSLVIVGSYGALLPSENYWKSVLPDTPMPKSLMELLPSGVGSTSIKPQRITNADKNYKQKYYNANDEQVHETTQRNSDNPYYNKIIYAAEAGQVHNNRQFALFFLVKNMYRGGKLYFNFIKLAAKPSMFLPRSTAQTIPFSSAQIPEILTRFSVKPDSVEGKFMKETILECVSLKEMGEEKKCPISSLESMIDFSVSKFGKKVLVLSSEVEKAKSGVQGYSIKGVKKMASDNAVVCHKQYYPYAVFYCHKTNKVDTYKVSMIGDDGTKAEAVAVCHKDTSAWNPKHTAFMVLKVKPGTVSVCHFLPQDTVVWVPY